VLDVMYLSGGPLVVLVVMYLSGCPLVDVDVIEKAVARWLF
jgi:hypothetical protein